MLWSTVHLFLVLLFENNDVIGAQVIILPRAPRILSADLVNHMFDLIKDARTKFDF